ncbi:MAG: hypothetical protein BGO70_10710 [Bacteroidetes bacterium 43-93]|nr:hypothetical protein [Bacteroidota bacterium]OJW95586.1 MAG: hypothetical protein BGO70_10710 [Bacteroidetes bacterium 43-93]
MGALPSYAQSNHADSISTALKQQQAARDSAIRAREEAAEANKRHLEAYRDSMAAVNEARREAQKRFSDSLRAARQHFSDSMKEARQRRADSFAVIREYKASRFYRDSVKDVREQRLAAIQAIRKAHFDSLKAARQKITDSIKFARKTVLDSIHAVQKHRSDSLAKIRKYKESRRFRDSVEVVRKLRADSIKLVRKHHSDSLIAARKHVTDSFARVRKARSDSLAAVRKARTDSLTALRKVKADSLAKAKEKRVKDQKVREQDKEKRQQLAFELKIKKKHQAYSNEKMLKKHWGLPRQVVQNSFTRYNYYFNAVRKMDEAKLNMARVRRDNYDSLLALFQFDPDKDSASIAPDMDSVIRKVSVGIQIHDPRVKWGDDLYVLLGQAYFYKGNYSEAASAFRYALSLKDKKKKKSSQRVYTRSLTLAQKEKKGMLAFLQHRSVHNEAILWLARTFTQMKEEGNAESVLDLLDTDPNFPKSMQGRLSLEKANIALRQNDYKAAEQHLAVVANDDNIPNTTRMRAAFIGGQLQMRRSEYPAAIASFNKVIDLYPKIDMDFYARKNLAYSTMLAGGDQSTAIASLKKVLNDGKYIAYYEQVYFVLGNLAASNGDYPGSINYLNKGISSPKATRKQKAISFATLGGIYYKLGDYSGAKAAYDSAVAMAQAAPNDSLVMVAIKRSSALNSITVPYNVIHMQDSLLAMSQLSDKEQKAQVRKHIRRLEQAREDSVFRAENAAFNNANNAASNNNSGFGNGGNAFANWYFANPSLIQQGMNEFKRKWGNRQLADNWRRSVSNSFDNNVAQDTATSPNANNPDLDENGLPTEESLLAYIPTTPEMKKDAVGKMKRAYVDLATAYIKDLEDYPPAIKTMDTLDKKYPQHEYQAEVLYLRYLVATRQNKLSEAQNYANTLLQQFQDTKWADLVRPSESAANLDTVKRVDESVFYDETYDLLMSRQYATVLARVGQARRMYGDISYGKRFTIIEGAALAGNGSYKPADSVLTQFVTEYPTDSLRPWADALLKYIQANKSVPAAPATDTAKGAKTGGTPLTPLPVDTAKTAKPFPVPPAEGSVTSAGNTASSVQYVYNIKEPHYVMFAYGPMEARSMGVKAALGDFNTFRFGDQHLSVDLNMLAPDRGIIAVKSFRNIQTAVSYMNAAKKESKITTEYKPGEYQWLLISASNYDKLLKDRKFDAYLSFYNANYK